MDNPVLPPPALDIYPRERLHATAISVTIESSNVDDAIYYTLDGSLPTTNSPRYTGSLILSVPTNKTESTLRTFGINRYGARGNLYEVTYTIDPGLDSRAPTIVASSAPGHHPHPIDVVFTVFDDRLAPVKVYMTQISSTRTHFPSSKAVAGAPPDKSAYR